VIVEIIIGLNLACPASIILSINGTPFFSFSLILSTKKMAVLTITPISEIKPIANAILYGLPVTHNPKFTHNNAVKIEYKTIAGLLNELNIYTSNTKVKNNATTKASIAH
jgi:hypothetical protein